MNLDHYHPIFEALTQAERQFALHESDWSAEDRELYRLLRLFRAEILKRESGHPFGGLDIIRDALHVEPEHTAGEAGGFGRGGAIKVLLADDESLIRRLLRQQLAEDPCIEVVNEAANGHDAVIAALKSVPDVVIMDIDMPVMNGVEAAKHLLAIRPESKIVFYTGGPNTALVKKAIDLGAVSLLYKPTPTKQLIATIRGAQAGQRVINSRAAAPISTS